MEGNQVLVVRVMGGGASGFGHSWEGGKYLQPTARRTICRTDCRTAAGEWGRGRRRGMPCVGSWAQARGLTSEAGMPAAAKVTFRRPSPVLSPRGLPSGATCTLRSCT